MDRHTLSYFRSEQDILNCDNLGFQMSIMTRLFNINAAILAMSTAGSAFTSLTPPSSSHSVFTGRSFQPLHMSLSHTFGDWELPDETPDGGDDTSLMESPLEVIKFFHGDDLQRLRIQVLELRAELYDAKAINDAARVLELQHSIVKAQQHDAEFVYSVSLERMEAAEARGRWVEAEKFRVDAMEARQALPQFNLDGLWVGK
jgi:hypothetical protein